MDWGAVRGPEDCLRAVEYVVKKRTTELEYLKRLYDGGVFWMNVVEIQPVDIVKYYEEQTLWKRNEQHFCLGVSFATLLQYPNGLPYLKACSQLLEEYEYCFGSLTKQLGMKLKGFTTDAYDTSDVVKPRIVKMHGQVMYQKLHTPPIPFGLGCREVVRALCDVLTVAYQKFMDESSADPTLCAAILRIDSKLKHHFFGFLSKIFHAISAAKLKRNLASMTAIVETFSPAPEIIPTEGHFGSPSRSDSRSSQRGKSSARGSEVEGVSTSKAEVAGKKALMEIDATWLGDELM